MFKASRKVYMIILCCTVFVVFRYIVHLNFSQLSNFHFLNVINHLVPAYGKNGYIATTTENKTIDQQIAEIMTRINHTIPQKDNMYFNETTSALKSTAIILNYKPNYCVGDILIFQVEVFNYLGKRKTYGGDFLRARMISPNLGAAACGRIEDFNNGTYNIYFTLFWEGQVQISIRLLHASEGVSLLWKTRSMGYNYMAYTGKFLKQNQEVHTPCGGKHFFTPLYLYSQQEKCTYLEKKYNEVFYCIKLPGVPCEAFIALSNEYTKFTYFSNENKTLFTEIHGVEFPKQVERINVLKCPKTPMTVTSKCQIGTSLPFPSGYFMKGQWFPSHCNLTSYEPLLNVTKCLAGKMIYLMGDSTLRQWIEYFPKILKNLRFFNNHVSGWHRIHVAYDLENNIFIQWKKHGHPFVAKIFFSVKDHAYMANELDRLGGGSNIIIVLTIGQHFRPYPLPHFIKRLFAIRSALESLFLRSPDTKVIIKSENNRDYGLDVERFSDFHGYLQYLLVKDIFSGLNVGMIDAWDMSIAVDSQTGHPPEFVVMNQINLFLSYIC
ncbi:NXPE family member 1-like [Lithobates pipiens]